MPNANPTSSYVSGGAGQGPTPSQPRATRSDPTTRHTGASLKGAIERIQNSLPYQSYQTALSENVDESEDAHTSPPTKRGVADMEETVPECMPDAKRSRGRPPARGRGKGKA